MVVGGTGGEGGGGEGGETQDAFAFSFCFRLESQYPTYRQTAPASEIGANPNPFRRPR